MQNCFAIAPNDRPCVRHLKARTNFQSTPQDRRFPTIKRLPPTALSIFSSKDEPEDGGWGFLRSWGSFLVFGFDLGTGE